MLTRLTKPFLLTLTLVLLSSSLVIQATPTAAETDAYHRGFGAVEITFKQEELYTCSGDNCGEDYTRTLYEHTDIYPGGTKIKEEEDYRTEFERDITNPQACGFRTTVVIYEAISWTDYLNYKVTIDYPDAAQELGYRDGELGRRFWKGIKQFNDILRMRYEVPEGGCVDGQQQSVAEYDYTITITPAPDRDGDGIADRWDPCPDDRGSVANDGCPDPDKGGDDDEKCYNLVLQRNLFVDSRGYPNNIGDAKLGTLRVAQGQVCVKGGKIVSAGSIQWQNLNTGLGVHFGAFGEFAQPRVSSPTSRIDWDRTATYEATLGEFFDWLQLFGLNDMKALIYGKTYIMGNQVCLDLYGPEIVQGAFIAGGIELYFDDTKHACESL